jgi:hypothetical protein
MDWISQAPKEIAKCLNHLESNYSAFPLIGNWIIWKIGNGDQVLIGIDSWIGCKENHKTPTHLIHKLHRNGLYTLKQVAHIIEP